MLYACKGVYTLLTSQREGERERERWREREREREKERGVEYGIDLKRLTRCKLALIFTSADHRKFLGLFWF